MPTYQYACTACSHEFEAFQSFSDATLTECPDCTGRLRKVYGSVGVVFKGSGFYRTDSRNGDGKVGKKPDAAPAKSTEKAAAASGGNGAAGSNGSAGGSGNGSAGSSGSSTERQVRRVRVVRLRVLRLRVVRVGIIRVFRVGVVRFLNRVVVFVLVLVLVREVDPRLIPGA